MSCFTTRNGKNTKTLEGKVLYHETLMEDISDLVGAIAQGKFPSLFITDRT